MRPRGEQSKRRILDESNLDQKTTTSLVSFPPKSYFHVVNFLPHSFNLSTHSTRGACLLTLSSPTYHLNSRVWFLESSSHGIFELLRAFVPYVG